MLTAPHRMHARSDFTATVRRGRRASRSLLTVHLLVPAQDGVAVLVPPRAGLVVSRAVGGSVVRHRVARRLRHLLRERIAALPAGATMVVRAGPPAATATSRQLAVDLDAAVHRLTRPAAR